MQGREAPKTCEEKSAEPLRSDSAFVTAFETMVFGIYRANENISRLISPTSFHFFHYGF